MIFQYRSEGSLRMISRSAASRYLGTVPQWLSRPMTGPNTGIHLLTLNNPARKNAIGIETLNQFKKHVQIIQQSQCRVLIIDRIDLQEHESISSTESSRFFETLNMTFTGLQNLSMPTIAAVDGYALGAGFELALCTDFRIAGENAQFGFPETSLATIPKAGGTQRLSRLIGVSKAKELIFSGSILHPEDALRYGIVNYAVKGPSLPAVLSFAQKLLSKGPLALAKAKISIDKGMQMSLANGLELERISGLELLATKDWREGMESFGQKRKPIYFGK